jgi:hypothetical protein
VVHPRAALLSTTLLQRYAVTDDGTLHCYPATHFASIVKRRLIGPEF